jgi:hypothetical protein
LTLSEASDAPEAGTQPAMTRTTALALAALALTGCAGNDEAAPPPPTTTEVETVPLEEDRAYQLAFDFCESAPLDTLSLFGGDPEGMARSFSEEIRPSLREAALAGCLAALAGDDR